MQSKSTKLMDNKVKALPWFVSLKAHGTLESFALTRAVPAIEVGSCFTCLGCSPVSLSHTPNKMWGLNPGQASANESLC